MRFSLSFFICKFYQSTSKLVSPPEKLTEISSKSEPAINKIHKAQAEIRKLDDDKQILKNTVEPSKSAPVVDEMERTKPVKTEEECPNETLTVQSITSLPVVDKVEKTEPVETE